MSNNIAPALLFDGVCNLCNNIVQFIIKRDREEKFKFSSLQSVSGQALLKKYNLPTNDFDSFVFIDKDKYYLRSSAVLHVLKELGGVWKLFYVFIILPRPLRDVVYNVIARSRYKIFGKRNTCMIPTQRLKQRFLD